MTKPRTVPSLVQGLMVAAMIALSATRAQAQAGSVILGAGAGAGVPFGSLKGDFNIGPSYSVWAGAGLSDYVDLMVRFGESFLDQKGESQFLFDTTDLTLLMVTVGPKLYLAPPSSPFRPFVSFELGYAGVEADDAGNNPIADDKRFGFDGGGGLSFGSSRASFDVEARYYRSVGSGSDLGYIVPLVGLTYRFGGESNPAS